MLDEPLAYELLRKLALGLALGQFLLIAISIEITAGVWSMYLVDEIYLTIALAKLLLCVDEDESALGGNLLTTGKNLAGVVFHDGVVLC